MCGCNLLRVRESVVTFAEEPVNWNVTRRVMFSCTCVIVCGAWDVVRTLFWYVRVTWFCVCCVVMVYVCDYCV